MLIGNIDCYGVIYKITNKVNEKVYIGQTTRNRGFDERYNKPGVGIERVYRYHKYNKDKNRFYNSHLLNSISKYGFSAFEVIEVFDIAFSKSELDIKEKSWIKIYNSTNDIFGYNCSSGGSNGNNFEGKSEDEMLEIGRKISDKQSGEKHWNYGKHWSKSVKIKNSMSQKGKVTKDETRKKLSDAGKGRVHSDDTKKKISESNKGENHPLWNTKATDETREKMSKSHSGEKNHFYGKNHSQESKIKMRKSKKGMYDGSKNPRARKIICVTTGEVFDCAKDASDKYGLSGTSVISAVCRGKRKSAGKLQDGTKLIWAYLNE